MARYTGPVCRLCRRETMKLFLKGARCYSDKCAIEKRNFFPGEHGRMVRRRRELIGYGAQLREKQKVKRIYGVLENQFRNYFKTAARKKGVTGEWLLRLLEQRLDNVVYRLGIATSRNQARQFVRHGHINLNGRRVNIPSCQVRVGDEITVRDKSKKNVFIISALEQMTGKSVPEWLSLDAEQFRGEVMDAPKREHVNLPVEEQLIVELYSK